MDNIFLRLKESSTNKDCLLAYTDLIDFVVKKQTFYNCNEINGVTMKIHKIFT